ncbi:unnamed protein product [Blepharisma stoltei]|uniref:ATP-dependent RNA helicase n=1 Tax=Blepharisma stoltei TaxID=1481888 RepID=A0AAU9K838_9CILI|nr:unnamed protein product [Blepharisma stoltei]
MCFQINLFKEFDENISSRELFQNTRIQKHSESSCKNKQAINKKGNSNNDHCSRSTLEDKTKENDKLIQEISDLKTKLDVTAKMAEEAKTEALEKYFNLKIEKDSLEEANKQSIQDLKSENEKLRKDYNTLNEAYLILLKKENKEVKSIPASKNIIECQSCHESFGEELMKTLDCGCPACINCSSLSQISEKICKTCQTAQLSLDSSIWVPSDPKPAVQSSKIFDFEDNEEEKNPNENEANFDQWVDYRRGALERAEIIHHNISENDSQSRILFQESEELQEPDELSTFRYNKEWNELPIPARVLRAIERVGYSFPSKIQNYGIDLILKEGHDSLIAQAPTGSGKTATFVIGSLCRIDTSNPNTQAVCICHTYEMTKQNYEEYQRFAKYCGVSVGLIIRNHEKDRGQVLVCTSGTFFKSLKSKYISIKDLKVVVMDEADFLWDKKDNLDVYQKIKIFLTKSLGKNMQALLFSATFPEDTKDNMKKLLGNVNEISVKKMNLISPTIDHYYIVSRESDKLRTLVKFLKKAQNGVTIVFVNSRDRAQTVFNSLSDMDWSVALLIGKSMTTSRRESTMSNFKAGRYSIIVTTNLLARGIDNIKVKCVVNLDLPRFLRTRKFDEECYIHRVGRCSRFGRHGIAINIISDNGDLSALKRLEEAYHIEIKEIKLAELGDILNEEREQDVTDLL